MSTQPQFTGYYHADIPLGVEDSEVTRVGPRTPCGELMRRYWQPIALSAEVDKRPLPVRILGEDLVLFRRPDRAVGLLHRHCLHRGTSLEYGRIEASGLRCCYHGWLYDIDGTLLETPLEPANSPIRKRAKLGAYPVRECRGLVFAYMGPPDRQPEFPIYDTFTTSDTVFVNAGHHFETNWFHLVENNFDMAHTVYLHTIIPGNAQFYDSWGVLPQMEYVETPIGYRYTYSRRVEDCIWVGLEDIVFPNFTQAGAIFSMDGRRPRYFGRGSYSRWLVPLDDFNTRVFVLGHFNEHSDPYHEEYSRPDNLEVMEAGARLARTYEERQREPSDVEAAGSQGPIYLRTNEHLGTTDKGVALFRRRFKALVRALAAGTEPVQPAEGAKGPIATCAGDSVLRIPRAPGDEDEALVARVASEVMAIYVDTGHLPESERRRQAEARLVELERSHQH